MTDFARFGVELHSQAGHYNHRYCVLVSGQEKWTWKVAQQLCQCFEPRRIVAISTSQNQSARESFPVTIDPGQARRFLGTETSSVVGRDNRIAQARPMAVMRRSRVGHALAGRC